MRRSVLLMVIAIGVFIASGAYAQVADPALYISANNIHSGTPGDSLDFWGGFYNNGADPLYINGWEMQDSSGAPLDLSSSGITFDTLAGWGNTGYKFGTTLASGDWFNGDIFSAHTDLATTSAAIYTGDYVLKGGLLPDDMTELARMSFTLEIVSDYTGFTNTLLDPIRTGGTGDVFVFQHEYTNAGDRTIYINGMWTSLPWDPNLKHDFLYGWPGQIDASLPGDPPTVVDANIFSYTVEPGALLQNNSGQTAMTGGYYPGDNHSFIAGQWQVDVVRTTSAVPEPTTLLGFGLPMLMIGLGKLRGLRK